MLKLATLRDTARQRLRDADALLKAKRYDGGAYLCGYAVEIALKVRICKTLGWTEFPESTKEFEKYRSFQIHDLNMLLHLSGREQRIKAKFSSDWSIVTTWLGPVGRYTPAGRVGEADLVSMIASASQLLRQLL